MVMVTTQSSHTQRCGSDACAKLPPLLAPFTKLKLTLHMMTPGSHWHFLSLMLRILHLHFTQLPFPYLERFQGFIRLGGARAFTEKLWGPLVEISSFRSGVVLSHFANLDVGPSGS